MLEHITIPPPHDIYQVLKTHTYDGAQAFKALGMASPVTWPLSLTRKGFSYVKNLWDFEHNQPLGDRKITHKFKLDNRELRAIETMTIPTQWLSPIQNRNIQAPIRSWVGSVKSNDQDAHPIINFQSRLSREILDEGIFPPPPLLTSSTSQLAPAS